jgi:hypothetical protein
MSELSRPPGGPIRQEFREAIGELAKQAREEDHRAWAAAQKLARPISKFIRIGVVLILLQGVVFLFLYGKRHRDVAVSPPETRQVLPSNSCSNTLHQTYWRIVAYARDHKGHPPASLDQLVGKYVDKVPADPASGEPLHYSTDGKRFEVRCPGAKLAR